MKIAMMVRSFIPAPRPADMIYAPIDLAISICDGLTRRGHTVDLYSPLGSKLEVADVKTSNLRALATTQQEFKELISDIAKTSHFVPALWDSYMAGEMFERARSGEYDLLHFHHPESALALARSNPNIPVVYTLHDPVFNWFKELFEMYHSDNQKFISISNNQRRDAPDLPYAGTVYNGIPIEHFPYSDTPEDYLLFAGRIVPEKGVKEAIQVAKAARKRLIIIGPVYQDSQGYFDQYIQPQLDDQILHLGYVAHDQMWRYYSKAQALLTPVQWEEPFGLTTVEAMACGTPVLSLRRGAAPELIEHGKTGFVVDSISEMVDAVSNIPNIERGYCRDYAKQRFSVDQMVDGYESAFAAVLSEQRSFSTYLLKQRSRLSPLRIIKNIRRSPNAPTGSR